VSAVEPWKTPDADAPGLKNGPELWLAILAPIRAVFGDDAVIAGGAVRDYLLGFDPKDIDVFVNVRSIEELLEGADKLDNRFTLAPLDEELTEYEQNPDWVNEVSGVLDGGFLSGIGVWDHFDLQVIGRPSSTFSGATLVSRFDIGITRCWFDGEIHDTPYAGVDREGKTLSLLRHDTPEHIEASRGRATRFIRRHAEFKFGSGWAPRLQHQQ
jgi:hypothetical protein